MAVLLYLFRRMERARTLAPVEPLPARQLFQTFRHTVANQSPKGDHDGGRNAFPRPKLYR